MKRPQLNLILAVTGASGALYAVNFIRHLIRLTSGHKSLIVSNAAIRVYREETGSHANTSSEYLKEVLPGSGKRQGEEQPFHIHDFHDIGASIASGSQVSDGMVILPCSMKTVAALAHGYSDNLISRAADVTLKERRRLVVVPRETPYSLIHLRNMTALAETGAIILPASPAFYQKPRDIDDMATFITGKILSSFGMEHRLFDPWDPELP